MPLIDFKALSRLPPEERVKVLARLEDQLQKIIKERTQEIEQSKREIAEAESLLQRAKDELVVLEKIATPEAKAVRIDDLFFGNPKTTSTAKDALNRKPLPSDESLQERADRGAALRLREEAMQREKESLEQVASTYKRPEQQRDFNPQAEAYKTAIGPAEFERPTHPSGTYEKKTDHKPKIVSEGVYKRRDDD